MISHFLYNILGPSDLDVNSRGSYHLQIGYMTDKSGLIVDHYRKLEIVTDPDNFLVGHHVSLCANWNTYRYHIHWLDILLVASFHLNMFQTSVMQHLGYRKFPFCSGAIHGLRYRKP